MKQSMTSYAPIKAILACAAALLISACTIYKPELSQGNLMNTEQIAKLQLGQSKSQVQALLGSPLLQDVFHANRWEYIFRQVKGEKTLEQRVFTVEFDSAGKLIKWTGIGKGDTSQLKLNNPLGAAETAASTPSAPIASAQSAAAPAAELPLAMSSGLNQGNDAAKAAPRVSEAVQTISKADASADLLAAIEQWRASWEQANLPAYLAHYSSTYIGKSRNRAAWEADRKRMIAGRKIISIALTDIKVQQTSDSAARAYFKQRFEADQFQEAGEKTLLLSRISGQWLIVDETFTKA